jgi:hypothetical protein
MPALTTYEVFALRYAENPAQPAARNFIDGDAHDKLMPLDYFIWLIRGPDRAYVVDTGFDGQAAKQRSRVLLASPGGLLSSLGVDSEQVSDVIVTHMHYDHCGNRELFSRARFHLQDREMAYATGRCMCHPALSSLFDVRDVAAMVERGVRAAGSLPRWRLRAGAGDLAPSDWGSHRRPAGGACLDAARLAGTGIGCQSLLCQHGAGPKLSHCLQPRGHVRRASPLLRTRRPAGERDSRT